MATSTDSLAQEGAPAREASRDRAAEEAMRTPKSSMRAEQDILLRRATDGGGEDLGRREKTREGFAPAPRVADCLTRGRVSCPVGTVRRLRGWPAQTKQALLLLETIEKSKQRIKDWDAANSLCLFLSVCLLLNGNTKKRLHTHAHAHKGMYKP
jgi:hypothetical protein